MSRRSFAVRVLTATLLVASVASVASVAVVLASPVGAEPGFTQVQAMPKPFGPSPYGGAYPVVSCPSATKCVALGYNDGGAVLSAATETAGNWGTPVKVALPPAVDPSAIPPFKVLGLSCPAEGTCTAVGAYQTTDAPLVPLVITEVAGTWQPATAVTLPSGAPSGSNEDAEMNDVDCVSTGNCVAVGAYFGNNNVIHLFSVTQVSGGAWTASKVPDVSGISTSNSAVAESLSCSDTSDCTVVGQQIDDSNQNGVAWRRTSGTWSSPATMSSAGDSQGFLPQAVACPDATTCVAVGAFETFTYQSLPGVAIETSGTWAAATPLPFPTLSPQAAGGAFLSISCHTAAVCEAVGSFGGAEAGSYVATPQAAGAATWSDGSWSSIGYVRGVRAGANRADDSQPTSVSCVTTTQCTAVGSATDLGAKGNYAFSADLTPVRTVSSPLQPTGVAGKGVPGGAVITWNGPVDDGGAPVRSFTVTAEPGAHTCTTTTESCALHGLHNGHGYRVDVTDRTSYGSSANAVDTRLVVAGRAPTTPAGVRLAFASGRLTVTWHASSSPAGEPVRYTVTVHEPHGVVRHLATVHLRVTVPAGASGTYAVVIVARNASGSSRPRRAHASKG